MTEADTGHKYVLPKLIDAGWDNDPHSFTEQKTFTRPKMLYLADRNFLIDDPKDKVFTPFDEARWKIENGEVNYQYSLRQGIEDGFLAPYRVHRVISTWDASGWRPSQGDRDRYGRALPDEEYQTKDFELVVALRARTEAIARHLTDFLKKTDRFAKTIVFCVEQDHADEMRRTLNNCNADLVQQYPDYVCRVTADEGQIGRGHLSRFQELETTTPAILTTSQLLTTGIDAPMCQNIVLARVILNDLLDKYAEHGTAQFVIPDVLKVPPISEHGNVIEIASLFGGAEKR